MSTSPTEDNGKPALTPELDDKLVVRRDIGPDLRPIDGETSLRELVTLFAPEGGATYTDTQAVTAMKTAIAAGPGVQIVDNGASGIQVANTAPYSASAVKTEIANTLAAGSNVTIAAGTGANAGKLIVAADVPATVAYPGDAHVNTLIGTAVAPITSYPGDTHVNTLIQTAINTNEPPPPPPPPPPAGARVEESWEAPADGVAPTVLNTRFDLVTGAGGLLVTSDWWKSAGQSLEIAGSTVHFGTFARISATGEALPIVTKLYVSEYIKVEGSGANARWWYGPRLGDDSGFAAQIGITGDNKVTVTNGVTVHGTTVALPVGEYLRESVYTAQGNQVHTFYNRYGTVVATLTAPFSAANIKNESIGNLVAITGGGSQAGELWSETWGNVPVGEDVTPTNVTSATGVTGAGSMKGVAGGVRVNGLASHFTRKTLASGMKRYYRTTVKLNAAGTNIHVPVVIYDGAGTAVVAQLRIDTTGAFNVRNKNTTTVASSLALALGTTYDLQYTVTANADVTLGTQRLQLFNGATSFFDSGEVDCDAVNIGGINFGNAVKFDTGTPIDVTFGPINVSDVAMPGTAVGGGSAVTIRSDYLRSSSLEMPVRLPFENDPDTATGFDAILAPLNPNKVVFGMTTPQLDTGGSTKAGQDDHAAVLGGWRPAICSFYKANGWSGAFSSGEISQINQGAQFGFPDGRRALVLMHVKWKGYTWAQVAAEATSTAAGSIGEQIDTMVANLKAYNHKIFLTFFHEPENDLDRTLTTQDQADFRLMQRNIWTRFANSWGSNRAKFPVRAINYMGFAGHESVMEGLWPGDDIIDVIGADPYGHKGDNAVADMFDFIYRWMEQYHPLKPIMIMETGLPFFRANSDPDVMTDTEAAANFAKWVNQLTTLYPKIRWIVYWSSVVHKVVNGVSTKFYSSQILGRSQTLYSAAEAMLKNDKFAVNTSLAP